MSPSDPQTPGSSEPDPASPKKNSPAATTPLGDGGPGAAHGAAHNHGHSAAPIWALALSAIGVVFGDIGTSPLYALKECFHGPHAIRLDEPTLLGVLSLIFWSLTLVVTLKYLAFVTKADNQGEGGIFSLLALINKNSERLSPIGKALLVLAAILGASLLYGDGVITPAMSVLSAVEGLKVAIPNAAPFTLPITCAILIGLFMIQRHGTGKIGGIFGPVMITWFTTLAGLGIWHILQNPQVLWAINPIYAIKFFQMHQLHSFVALGSVVLCITGGEALYADMGHFGRRAIKLAWYSFVFPALILNYFGQGALLLKHPEAVSNPFFSLVPSFLVLPMVFLATFATIIASQALISGVFSLTRQAIQMGYLPRLQIVHTSSQTEGQIYVPLVNHLMMMACVLVVLIFKESSNLAAAYGLAVTADMVLTSSLFFFVLIHCWKWSLTRAIPLVVLFLVFDLAYFGSSLIKFFDGGWFPAVVAACILTVMLAWRDGRKELSRLINSTTLPLYHDADGSLSLHPQPGTGHLFLPKQHLQVANLPVEFLTHEMLEDITRVPGTALFMSVSPQRIPTILIHHLKLNHVLHEQVILLSVRYKNQPIVPPEETLEIHDLGQNLYQVTAWFGFMQTPDVPALLHQQTGLAASTFHKPVIAETMTYFLGHQTLLIRRQHARMMRWRKVLFAFMSRNATPATTYFCLPSERVIEIGMHIEL